MPAIRQAAPRYGADGTRELSPPRPPRGRFPLDEQATLCGMKVVATIIEGVVILTTYLLIVLFAVSVLVLVVGALRATG